MGHGVKVKQVGRGDYIEDIARVLMQLSWVAQKLFALMLLQIPIGFAMIIVGIVGFALQSGWGPALTLLVNEPTGVLSSADLATVPLFLLMGTFASVAGFSTDIYNAAAAFLGHRRGGLAYATMGGSAVFGVVCGSSTATAATFARAALPEMLKRGYSPALATGTIASGGTLGILIPPSLVMVIYAYLTEQFVITLFVAALIPALIATLAHMATIALVVWRNPQAGPPGKRMSWAGRLQVLKECWGVIALLLCVVGSIYGGIFTVNESSTIGMLLALQDMGKAGKVKFVGFDASQVLVDAMRAHQLDGIVVQNPMRMGYLGVKTIVAQLRAQPFEKHVDTGVTVVTPETIDQPEMQALLNPPIAKYLGAGG